MIDIAKKYAEKYKKAEPFPNIVFNNFFDSKQLNKVLNEFSETLKKKDILVFDNEKEMKLANTNFEDFGIETKKFIKQLQSKEFLDFLQELTGIERPLIADKYLLGGGLHEIKRGGVLKIHADFNKHKINNTDRRVNVLIYLNKNWKKEYGGYLELWSEDMKECKKKIPPTFNTIAIFSTNDYSYHGHPDPLNCPQDMSRKSIALYYYTKGRPEEEIIKGQENHSTLYKKRLNK